MSRVVLVTGCSTGIGLTTAVAFARRGDRVYASMRALARGDELRRLVDAERLDVELIQLDVTEDVSVRSAVGQIFAKEGRLDVVVNNAGVGPFAPIERSTDEEWRSTIDTNLLGPMRVTRAALPSMRTNGGGVVITISSVAGRLPQAQVRAGLEAVGHGEGRAGRPHELQRVRPDRAGFGLTQIDEPACRPCRRGPGPRPAGPEGACAPARRRRGWR